MSDKKIEHIIEKYLACKASPEEISELDKWYEAADCQKDLYEPGSPELQQALDKQFEALKLKLGIM